MQCEKNRQNHGYNQYSVQNVAFCFALILLFYIYNRILQLSPGECAKQLLVLPYYVAPSGVLLTFCALSHSISPSQTI